MKDTRSFRQFFSFIPATNDILDSRIERRLRQTYQHFIWSKELSVNTDHIPTKNRITTIVSKFFEEARIMVSMLHITSMAGICGD